MSIHSRSGLAGGCFAIALALVLSILPCAAAAQGQDYIYERFEILPDPTNSQWLEVADGRAMQRDPYWGNYTSTHTWTSPPEAFGAAGFSLTLEATSEQKTGGGITMGTVVGGSGVLFDTSDPVAWAVVPVGAPGSASGSLTVHVRPAGGGAGQIAELRIGGTWGAIVRYRYRARALGPGETIGGGAAGAGAGGGAGADGDAARRLAARLDCPGEVVISALPSLNCHILISGWRRNTADPVEVILPQALDAFGNHPNGIQVHGTAGSQDVFAWVEPEYSWGMFVFACPGQQGAGVNCYGRVTAPGPQTVPIIVRQRGQTDVVLTLSIRAVARGGGAGAGAGGTATRLGNRWRAGEFLHIEAGTLAAGPILADWLSAVWDLTPVAGSEFVRLCNRWKPDQCLNTERGVIEAGPIRPEWWSAMWVVEPVAGTAYFRLRNRWYYASYLHVENGRPEIGLIDQAWWSAMWWGLQ